MEDPEICPSYLSYSQLSLTQEVQICMINVFKLKYKYHAWAWIDELTAL